MSDIHTPIPTIPPLLASPLRVVPLVPLAQALTVLARRLVRHHPGLINRLGPYVASSFAIAPTDLPVTLLLHPHPKAMRITLHRDPPMADARIAGSLAALLGLVHGTWDGDALFFSRDLVIDGDTSAAL
ncbi:MAG TPA: SCP2 sterol-binding domain-containing protein, partial [Hydrogenophaga sp.]